MAYICVDCGFNGKDNYALEEHMKTNKHLEIVGMRLINKAEDLPDIRKMNYEEQTQVIVNHEWYQQYNAEVATFFARKKRAMLISKILVDQNIIVGEGKYHVWNSHANKLKEEIAAEYSTDDDCDEKYERMQAAEYTSDQLKELHEEFIEWQTYFLTKAKKAQAYLPTAREAVRKRMIIELEAIDKAKLTLEQQNAKEAAKKNKKRALLELKIKELEIKNDIE